MDLTKIESVDEHCKSELAKIVEVQLERTAVQLKIQQHAASVAKRVSLDDEARAHLRGAPILEAHRDETLDELHKQLRVLARAEQIARDDFQAARSSYSREVCAQLERHNRELAQGIANPLELLVRAARAEREFRDALQAKGILCNLPVAAFPYLGFDLDNLDQGFAARWIHDVRKAGLIR